MRGFPVMYVLKRDIENASLLEEVALQSLVKPKLVSKMRSLQA